MNLILQFLYSGRLAVGAWPLGVDIAILALAALLGGTSHAAAKVFAPDLQSLGPTAAIAIAVAIGMAGVVLVAGGGLALAPGALLGWFLLTLALVDLATFRLPDALTFPLICLGLIAGTVGWLGRLAPPGFSWANLANHGIGAAAGYGAFAAVSVLFRKLRGRDGLGMGDAKLAAAAGAWLGIWALPTAVLVACGLAFVWVMVRWVRQGRESLQRPLPFGPPLAAAIWLCWAAAPN
jgi:leader peptidase (prepilin peptidase) / N-methyltransferase